MRLARRFRLFYPKQLNQPLSESAYCAHVVATQAETVDGMEVVWATSTNQYARYGYCCAVHSS